MDATEIHVIKRIPVNSEMGKIKAPTSTTIIGGTTNKENLDIVAAPKNIVLVQSPVK